MSSDPPPVELLTGPSQPLPAQTLISAPVRTTKDINTHTVSQRCPIVIRVFEFTPQRFGSSNSGQRVLFSWRPSRSFRRDESRIKCKGAGQKATGSHSTGVELEGIPLSEAQFSYVSKISAALSHDQYLVFTAILRSKPEKFSMCFSLSLSLSASLAVQACARTPRLSTDVWVLCYASRSARPYL